MKEITDKSIDKLKPRDKQYKEYLGKGLHVVVTPSGGKLFRMKYRFLGKEKQLSFGKFPYVNLLEAMELVTLARIKLKQGIDPAELMRERGKTTSKRALLQ